jgi:hypothetical protein
MFEDLSLSVQVSHKTKRAEGTLLSFFSEIKQEKKFSRAKLLFFCDKCGRHLLLSDKRQIQNHIEAHRRGELRS